MRYLHTDERLNGREEPLPCEQELIDSVDALLAELDPPGLVRDEAMWYLGTAPDGESNLEILLPLGWDREVPLRVLLAAGSFSIGWGGDMGEPPTFEPFRAKGVSIGEMIAECRRELARDIRISRRKLLFAGVSELHIRHGDAWVDLLRGGIPSQERALRAAVREVSLLEI